jgi:hypothetical protein
MHLEFASNLHVRSQINFMTRSRGNFSISSGNFLKIFYRHSREGENPVLFRIFWIPVFTGMTFGTGTY